ncbi:Tfo1 transposase [Alternaria alternata]|nr:Tfo1 transposase [Alternaria alternata]
MGWFVLEKYYNMTDQVPVYASAILLNPSSRAACLKKNWSTEWYEPAINAAQDFWLNEFKDALPLASPTASKQMAPPSKQRGAVLNQILQQMSVAAADTSNGDDLKAFAEGPVIQIDCSPLEWWCRSEQRQRYPRLSHMAIPILSIAAESSEPERTFSGARRTCSWDRSRLTCANIEKTECIGSWLREGHITPCSLNGMGLPMEPEQDEETEMIEDEVEELLEWT